MLKIMAAEVSLIFFVGPPFMGKTLYYMQKFSTSHQRFCPQHFFQTNPDISLRAVILKVVALLKKGKSVVVDDENVLRQTRESYINLIKSKVPSCNFKCIHFKAHPTQGRLQCNWAREWGVAWYFNTVTSTSGPKHFDMHSAEKRLHQWFEDKQIEIPLEAKGFEISPVTMFLVCDSPFKFELPCLLIQWEGILKCRDDQLVCREGVAEFINKWTDSNPVGRVIVLGDGRHTCKPGFHPCSGSSPEVKSKVHLEDSQTCECVADIKKVLRQLVEKVHVPMYFVFVEDTSLPDIFLVPPKPGLLAWLQRLHNISLTHRATLYLNASETHAKMASSVGLKCIKINSINCRTVGQAPECVKQSRVAFFGSFSTDEGKMQALPLQERPRPTIPLLDQAMASSFEGTGPFTVTMLLAGRIHGLCFRDLRSLDNYQKFYATSATPSELASSINFNSEEVKARRKAGTSLSNQPKLNEMETAKSTEQPSFNADDSVDKTAVDIAIHSDVDTVSRIEPRDDVIVPPRIKTLVAEDIEKQARTPGHYKRGEGCIKLVTGLSTTLGNDGLRISCKCCGSQGESYDLTALIAETGIVSASCTCQDPASKLGQCKHVVAMLLEYKDQEEILKHGTTIATPLAPSAAGSSYVPSVATSTSTTTAQDDQHNTSTLKRSLGRGNKRPRVNKEEKQTIYCMSQRELLETAKLVLQEHCEKKKKPNDDDESKTCTLKEAEDNRHIEKAEKRNIGQPTIREDEDTTSSMATKTTMKSIQSSATRHSVLNELTSGSRRNTRPSQLHNESTPPISLPRSQYSASYHNRVVVPESLVPDTITVIPETVGIATGSSRPPQDASLSQRMRREESDKIEVQRKRTEHGEDRESEGGQEENLKWKQRFGRSILDDLI